MIGGALWRSRHDDDDSKDSKERNAFARESRGEQPEQERNSRAVIRFADFSALP